MKKNGGKVNISPFNSLLEPKICNQKGIHLGKFSLENTDIGYVLLREFQSEYHTFFVHPKAIFISQEIS